MTGLQIIQNFMDALMYHERALEHASAEKNLVRYCYWCNLLDNWPIMQKILIVNLENIIDIF